MEKISLANTLAPYFLTLYVMVSVVNIAGQFQGTRRISRFTKPFLMPLLLLFMLATLLPEEGFSLRVVFISLALIFHTAGDVFLLFPLKVHFVLGLLSFLVGHVFYLCYFFPNIALVPLFLQLFLLAFVIVVFVVAFILVKKVQSLPLALASAVYALSLALLFCSTLSFCIARMTSAPFATPGTVRTILVPLGSLLFIASDIMNAYSRFVRKFKNRNFFVMLTYILAQTLIVFGVL